MKTGTMRCMPAAPALGRCTQSVSRCSTISQGAAPARLARAVPPAAAAAARQRSVRAASRADDSDETSEDDIKLDDAIDLLDFSLDTVLGSKGAAASSTPRRLRGGGALEADMDYDLDLDAIIYAAENGAGGEDASESEGEGYGDEGGASTSGSEGSGDDDGGGGEDGGGGGRNEYPPRPERSYGLRELLRAAGCGAAADAAPDLTVHNIMTCNSETAAPGSLYVCVPSTDAGDDGHEWAAAAVGLGAVAVLAERPLPDVGVPVVVVPSTLGVLGALGSAFYAAPSAQVRTVGLVGSYGKTTSAWLMRGMFEEAGELTGMLGSIEYAIAEDRLTAEGEVWEASEEDPSLRRDSSTPFHGIPYQGKYGCPETTPDALHLQKTLASMLERGATTVLAELCPTAAADGRCDALLPEILVFTNIFPERATAGGAASAAAGTGSGEEATVVGFAEDSVEGYVERVAAMFDRLTDPERQRAVVNIDDAHGPAIAERAEAAGAAVLTFAVDDKTADVTVEKVKSSIWETELMVVTPLGRLQIIVPLLGKMHTYNVLAAVAVGITAGVPLKAIVAGIEAVDIIPGRSEIVDEGQQFTIMVDAARSPEALSRLLDDVKECGGKRTLLVVGCPGDTTREHRAAIGQVAHFKAEAVFLTNDNPGRGFPDEIIADIVSGLPEEVHSRHAGSVYPWLQDQHRVPQWFEKILLQYQSEVQRYIVEDRFSAIRVAVGMAKKGDVVLVVGKGHEDFQEYWDGITEGATVKAWFDDRVECRNAVSKLGYLNSLKDFDRAFLPWTRYPEERELLITAGIADAEDPDALTAT